MAIQKQLGVQPVPDQLLMHGVPLQLDGRDVQVPRRLVTVAVPAIAMSQDTWDKLHGSRFDGVETRPLLEKTEATPLPSIARVSVSKQVIHEWLQSQRRQWFTLTKIFRSSPSITHLTVRLWEQKYGKTQIPDKVIFIAIKSKGTQTITTTRLDVIPFSDDAWKNIPEGRACLVLQRQTNGLFVPTPPMKGTGVGELTVQWMSGDTGFAVKTGVQRAIARSLADLRSSSDQVLVPTESQFLAEVQSNAKDLVSMWNAYQCAVKPDVEILPDVAVLSVSFQHGLAYAPRLLTPAETDTGKMRSQVWMRQITPLHYWPFKLYGFGAVKIMMSWLEGMGYVVKDPVERRMVVATMRKSGEDMFEDDLTWNYYLGYIAWNASQLLQRFQQTYTIAHGPDSPMPDQFLTVFERVKVLDDGTERVVVEGLGLHDANSDSVKYSGTMGGVFWQTVNGRLVPGRLFRTGASEVVMAWLAGNGVRIQSPVEHVAALGILRALQGSREAPRLTWAEVKQFAAGGHSALNRLRLIYETLKGEPLRGRLVWVGRRERDRDDSSVKSFSLYPEGEVPEGIQDNASYFKVAFGGTDDDVVTATGSSAAESLKESILSGFSPGEEGGITLAPDAPRLESEAQQFLDPEIFVSDDVKTPALTTPAVVLPVLQSDRPADAVELPREGGFQITDPEVARKFATPPSDKIPVVQVYRRGFVRSGDTVAGGIAAVFDHYFAEHEASHVSDSAAWGSVKAGGIALGKVAVTLPFAIGDAVHRIVSEVPKGPVPTVARAAQLFISGPFEGAANMGRGARHAWDARDQMTSAQNSYVWTQVASQLALLVFSGAKTAKGVGGFIDGIGPDMMPMAMGESSVAVASVSVPALSMQPVAGALMMSAAAPDFAKAAEGVENSAKNGSLKPDEIAALWRFLIPHTPPQLSRQMVSAVLTTLPHDAMGAVLAVVELTRRLVENKADGGLRVLMANTLEPQLSSAWKWGVSPELWQGMVSELSKGSPRNLIRVGDQFLKWVAYRRNDQVFQSAVPQIWQQLLDSLVAIEGPERIQMMNALGNKIQGRSGLTPAMKAAFEKASQSVR